MSGTYSTIYPWIIKQLNNENNKILVCMANLQSLTQTDLGIRPEFQCPNSDGVKILKTLSDATTPLDKLLILKKTINNISECINRNTTTKYCNHSLELATDDIVLIVIWIILKTSRSYENIYYDLYYAMDYHFLNTSKNELGFSLCHFQVAMSWLSSRAIDTPIYTKNKTDYYDFSTSPTVITTLNKTANHTNGSSNSNEVSDDRIVSSIDNINNSMDSTTSSPVTSSLKLQLSLPIDTITKDESSPLLPVGICIEAGNYNARYINEINALDSDLLIDYDISLSPRKSRPTSARTTNGKDLSNLSLSLTKSSKKITRSGNQIVIYKHFNNQDYEYSNLNIQSEESNKILDITSCQSNSNSYSVITVDGGLYAWGQPYSGRLGQSVSYELDSFDFILSPERICTGSDIKFKQVSCGRQHMLAVTEQGEVYAWGDNRCAQLGISTTKAFNNVSLTPNDLSVVMASSPTIVESLKSEKVDMVACGSYHSLCLTTSGVVYSWGRAANGRLGQFPCRLSIPEHAVGRPTVVRGPWVNNNDKNIGNLSPRVNIKPYISNGINSSNTSPLIITKETYSKNNAIKTNPNRNNIPKLIPNQSFRLELSDKLYVSNSYSKLTKSDSFDSISTGLSNSSIVIVSIAAGFSHSIAISSNGKVFSWGCGTHGRLGHGSHCDEYLPKQIAALNKPNINIVSASAGLGHSLFLTKEGLLFGCGLNDRDQVGISISENVVTGNYSSEKHSVLVPHPISIKPDSLTDVSLDKDRFIPQYIESISCGDYHNAALTINGKVYIWGNTTKLLNRDKDINKDRNDDIFRLLSLSSDCVPKQISAAGDSTMIIV